MPVIVFYLFSMSDDEIRDYRRRIEPKECVAHPILALVSFELVLLRFRRLLSFYRHFIYFYRYLTAPGVSGSNR